METSLQCGSSTQFIGVPAASAASRSSSDKFHAGSVLGSGTIRGGTSAVDLLTAFHKVLLSHRIAAHLHEVSESHQSPPLRGSYLPRLPSQTQTRQLFRVSRHPESIQTLATEASNGIGSVETSCCGSLCLSCFPTSLKPRKGDSLTTTTKLHFLKSKSEALTGEKRRKQEKTGWFFDRHRPAGLDLESPALLGRWRLFFLIPSED